MRPKSRQSASSSMTPGRKKLTDISFCALDLETTGINAALHMIVEVGLIRFTLSGGEETFTSLVNPDVKMPDTAFDIHGISDEMVRHAPRIGDILDEIAEFISGSILVVHCPEFDLAFLGYAFRRSEKRVPDMAAVDTVRLSRRAYRGLQNHRLDTLCRHLKIDIVHHRASSDARACMDIFSDIVRGQDPEGAWTLADLREFHGEYVRFTGRKHVKRSAGLSVEKTGIRLGARARITYTDQSGAVTVREIDPREFVTLGSTPYLLAFCYLRNDIRYFRLDRIISVN